MELIDYPDMVGWIEYPINEFRCTAEPGPVTNEGYHVITGINREQCNLLSSDGCVLFQVIEDDPVLVAVDFRYLESRRTMNEIIYA